MAETIIHGNQNTTKLINALKSSSMQYPVLNKDQERELIEKYRNDRDRLNFLLFMHNIRTVFSQAKAYITKTDDFDSLVQNGMLGLAEAVRRFDIDRDIKFCTYANTWVHKYLSMPYYTAQFKLDMKTVSMNAPSQASDSDDAAADDTLENCIQNFIDPSVSPVIKTVESEISANEQSEICGDLYAWMDSDTSLSATDRAVFREIFVDREKTRNIAEKYKLDMNAVSEIKHRILGKCRDMLERRYSITSYGDIG